MRTIVKLTLICLVLTGALALCSIDWGLQESRMSDAKSGISVAVARSWQGRYLTVAASTGERVREKLLDEWGPDLRTNVYRTTDGGIGVIDFAGTWKVLRDPLRLQDSLEPDAWQYLGTLLPSGFRDTTQEAECMDILMDEPPPPHRSWMYREWC